MVVLKLSGKAYQVFRYLELLAQLRGGDTLQKIMKEGKQNDRRKGTS